jgi:hypothetical protein
MGVDGGVEVRELQLSFGLKSLEKIGLISSVPDFLIAYRLLWFSWLGYLIIYYVILNHIQASASSSFMFFSFSYFLNFLILK